MELTKITFSGDIMLNNEVLEIYKTNEGDYNFDSIFSQIKSFLNESDFVVGNLETPISRNNEDLKYKPYRFTSPISFAESVKRAGFDFVSTANNHCLDNGIDGIKETVDSLNKVGLKHTGISYGEEKTTIENINNIKIAILSYTYGTNAFSNGVYITKKDKQVNVNLLQEQELSNVAIRKLYQSRNIIFRILRRILKELKLLQLDKPVYERKEKSHVKKKELIEKIKECKKAGAEYIIMCMHEGGQYNEKPLAKTKNTANFLQKSGADLVVGNHEHVIHECEKINGKLITYSLGNFLSTTGVLKEPFDKMSEYSILLNVYLERVRHQIRVNKGTFTICKTVIDYNKGERAVKVKLLYDLINECENEDEKNRLIQDNQKIVNIVTKQNIEIDDIKKEYAITNIK